MNSSRLRRRGRSEVYPDTKFRGVRQLHGAGIDDRHDRGLGRSNGRGDHHGHSAAVTERACVREPQRERDLHLLQSQRDHRDRRGWWRRQQRDMDCLRRPGDIESRDADRTDGLRQRHRRIAADFERDAVGAQCRPGQPDLHSRRRLFWSRFALADRHGHGRRPDLHDQRGHHGERSRRRMGGSISQRIHGRTGDLRGHPAGRKGAKPRKSRGSSPEPPISRSRMP